MNDENLIPANKRTREEAAELGRRGGVASGAARRKQKTFRESIKALLELETTDPEARAKLDQLGLDPSFLNAINLAQLTKAGKGDGDSARFLRDSSGELPRQQVELGNLEGRPLATIDLSTLSTEELQHYINEGTAES